MAGLGKIEVVTKPLEPVGASKPIDNKPIELKPLALLIKKISHQLKHSAE